MNQGLHRLVFNRHRGMAVAVFEGARSQGKAGRVGVGLATVAAALALGSPAAAQTRPPVVFAGALPAPANPLPQPYGTLRNASGGFVNDPALRNFVADPAQRSRVEWRVAPDGRSATFKQGDVDRVILNWDRFDVGAGHHVHFEQNKDPSRYVSALNRIWSADPSLILGRLTADREVVLLNSNGVYFGRGARVDTGKFVATANSISDAVFERGLRNVTDGSAVFSAAGSDYQPTSPDAAISVEAGAEIRSAAGGDVLLIAPRVANRGRIDTPQGQAVLAAGDRVYLMSSSDPAQRGLIVAVDPLRLAGSTTAPDPTLGIVENAADGSPLDATAGAADAVAQKVNEIRADSGSINLVGLTVRQAGQVNATTAVKGANGAVYLQAMGSTRTLSGGLSELTEASQRGFVVENGAQVTASASGGTVEIAAGSATRVRPSSSATTQLAAEVFNPSIIRVEGETITVAGGATVEAPSGRVELLAASQRQTSPVFSNTPGRAPTPDTSRIVVAPGARLSTAGVVGVEVDGARNQGVQRLFRIELADAPVQRDGPLYREQVFFDNREASRISVANVSGAGAGTGFTAREKSTAGGTLRIESEGTVVLGQGATIDVSGGSVRYSATSLQTSLLVRDGVVVQFRNAAPGTRYDALLGDTRQTLVPAYEEGRDGGSLMLTGNRLALSAELRGDVVEGELQRNGSSNRALPAALSIGRFAGNGQYLARLSLEAHRAPALDASLFESPATADLSAVPSTTVLSLPLVSEAGFGAVFLRADRVEQPGFGTLDLGPRGQFDVLARQISLDGSFTLPGGTLTLLTNDAGTDSPTTGVGDIRLSAGTRFDLAGRWTNDTAAAAGAGGDTPLQLDGGRVIVTAAHDLLVGPGAEIDVSGGAQLASAGALTRGKAGSVALAAGRSERFETRLQIDGTLLLGHDFGDGGTLTLAGPALRLAGGSAAPAGFTGLSLAPEFLSAGGFGNVSLDAFGDVTVPAGTRLEPTLASWELAPGHRTAGSGRMRDEVVRARPVDESLADRRPVNLSLSASRPLVLNGVALDGGRLVVERGASIEIEAGGTLALAASNRVEIGADGDAAEGHARLAAPGGRLAITLTGTRGASSDEALQDPAGFIGSQALWIGAGARLSVSGVAELRPDASPPAFTTFGDAAGASSAPRLTGSVRGGGSIELVANRGYVVLERGSRLALDGAAAALTRRGTATPVTVARPGGRLRISSPEGMVLEGDISARAPTDERGQALAEGGSLEVAMGKGGVNRFTVGPAYPTTPRQLLIDDLLSPLPAGARAGDDLAPLIGNGTAVLPKALLGSSGFDSLRLGAGDAIVFQRSMSLSVPQTLVLDSPALMAQPGVRAELSARSVAIGDRTLSVDRKGPTVDLQPQTDADLTGGTALRLSGRTIDVVGRSTLKGFSTVHLDAGAAAGGEIRLGAVDPVRRSNDGDIGSLGFTGELTLTSGQTFVTTASRFTLEGMAARDASDGGSRLVLRTGAAGASGVAPWSVFGELSAKATTIDHRGVLRQPFGAVSLQAERTLTLGDGGLTSVSGAGQTLLFGQTDNLTQWLPSGSSATRLPLAKGIRLSAASIQTGRTAVVDSSGGGDILAWEFFAGVGGSTDYLATDGLFAVIPSYGTRAPVSLAGGIQGQEPGGRELVVTMDGSGLAPGAYTLLPARLALLDGALPKGVYVVRRAAEQGSAQLGAPLVQDDGGIVITGSIREAGSAFLGAPGERFVVESADVFNRRSEIRLSSVSELLTRRAAISDLAVPPLPRDGGSIAVSSTGSDTSQWQAQLAAGGAGGRAGTLDMQAARLALVDDLGKTPAGALGVTAASLAGSGAGSVLIGGRRSDGAAATDGTPTVDIRASGTAALTVDVGAAGLTVDELILASSGSLDIAAGSRLQASANGSQGRRRLNLAGDGALVLVSADELSAERSGISRSAGGLSIGDAVQLRGRSVALDATAALQVDGRAKLDAEALSLTAPRLAIGALAAADPPGSTEPAATTLAGSLLDSVRQSPELTLRSYMRIDFSGPQDWAARPAGGGEATVRLDRLTLDAPLLRGLPDAEGRPASVDIAAREIVLRNTLPGGAAPAVLSGGGSLVLDAAPALQFGRTGGLTLGPGSAALGFGDVMLRSRGDLVLDGTGGVAALGELSLEAARLTATTAAEHTLQADAGTLTLRRSAGSRTLGERVGQAAAVTLRAREVVQDGSIDLASGVLDIMASGRSADAAAVRFGAGSQSSVAGFSVAGPDGFIVDGPAGRLRVSAGQGRIEALGTLDASAATRPDGTRGAGDAGSLEINAVGPGGELLLQQGATRGRLLADSGRDAADRGGSISLDLRHLPDPASLLAAVAEGGIDHAVQLRLREGDLTLAGALRAERVQLAADAGALRLQGATLDARAAEGGVVRLMAAGDLVLDVTSRIDARSTAMGASGGDVLLASANGRVQPQAGATVDARGDDAGDGRVVLRAARSADGTTLQVGPLQPADLQAGEVVLEAVRVYRQVTVGSETRDIATIGSGSSALVGSGTARSGQLGQASVLADSNAFMASAAGALGTLGVGSADRGRVSLRAGVEVQAAGNLSVVSDWTLQGARAGGEAGLLTLRAAGDLAINGSISDGFASAAANAALSSNATAWSYRLAAGADLAAADPLATRSGDSGSLSIAAGRTVRTGAGSIDLAAAQNMRFAAGSGSTSAGQAYVAGALRTGTDADAANALFAGHAAAARPTFTERGGRLTLQAGRDIEAPEASQLVTHWLWRSGVLPATGADQGLYARSAHLGWWSQFAQFQQTLGAFGGGSIRVRAGRDVVNLQAMASTAGWADSRVPADATLRTIGGGEIDVAAGRDLRGGQFLTGRGTGRLEAQGAITGEASNQAVDEPVLAQMGGASWRVSGREGVTVNPAFNPTAAPVPSANSRAPVSGFFYTWGDGAAQTLLSAGGDVTLSNALISEASLARFSFASITDTRAAYRIMPASLAALALGGEVRLLPSDGFGAIMFPEALGRLAVWADADVRLGVGSGSPNLTMSDAAVSAWPDFRRLVAGSGFTAFSSLINNSLAGTLAGTGLHAGDPDPARIHAGGSLLQNTDATWVLPKPARVSAGDDVLSLRLLAQNLADGDRTTVTAGRNFIADAQGVVELGGPGVLDVRAGREVDLGSSVGLRTIGNQRTASLPARGADIRLAAAAAPTLELAVFEASYLGDSPRGAQYRGKLRDYVRAALAEPTLDEAQAWAQFQRFPAEAQRGFAQGVIAAEFGAVYLGDAPVTPDGVTASLRAAFDRRKADLLAAGEAALAAGTRIVLPGREVLAGAELAAYLARIRGLVFEGLELTGTIAERQRSLEATRTGWRDAVAGSLGGTAAELDALAAAQPDAPRARAWREGLAQRSGSLFDQYREQVLEAETASAAKAASAFGRLSLPMRLALFDEGFRVAELAGAGSFVPQPVWPGATPVLRHSGALEMTQSAVITERGGDISLVNPGGGINVGLKVSGSSSSPKGVIALGGGNVFGFARDDFQVNTQRVFIVGQGDMTIWSSRGDIDSGRGANTAVGAPPLAPRRSIDGVVFEIPATTTGSGLGIVPDINGRTAGTIGLFPAFGEILALDAFIRAPSILLAAQAVGGDVTLGGAVGGSGAVVAPPPAAVSTPPGNSSETRTAAAASATGGEAARERSSLLTVELLGMGPGEPCEGLTGAQLAECQRRLAEQPPRERR